MSVRQGDELSALLREMELPWNRAFDSGPVVVAGKPPQIELRGGLRITLLSPTPRELDRLWDHWEKQLMKLRAPMDKAASFSVPADDEIDGDDADEGEEPEATPKATRGTPEGLDLEELADRRFRPDRSVANGSSIAFVAEIADAVVLVGGDARADVLSESIQNLLSMRGEKRLTLDAFVVPHAGSERNLSVELLQLLACDRYLFSTSGARFRHPDRVTVARILVHGRSGRTGRPTLVFNYRSPETEIWDDPELQKRYDYRTVYPEGEDAGIQVVLREDS